MRRHLASVPAASAVLLLLAACQGHQAETQDPVATIALTTTAVVVQPQETLTVTATPVDGAGHSLTGYSVSWTSSQPGVATVSSSGTVTAIAAGLTTLTATIDGVSASVTIKVAILPPPPPPVAPDSVGSLGAWTLVLSRPQVSKYEGVAFPDSLNGWVMSDFNGVVHTSDGGVTWSEQGPLTGHLRSMEFLDRDHGFIGTLGGVLYQTTNAGTTWTNITSALPKVPIGFCGIAHLGNKVYAVGRYEGATDFYYSPDGGATWQYHNLSTLAQGLVDVIFLSDSVGLIGGTSEAGTGVPGPATILKTTDGGQTWTTVFIDGAANGWAWKIFSAAPGILYAALETDDGVYRVAKSTDSGDSWSLQIVATNQPLGLSTNSGLQGIGFLDANVGWVGGFFPGFYATTNGGLRWTYVAGTSANINRFRRAGTTLFTAGTKGVLRYDARH